MSDTYRGLERQLIKKGGGEPFEVFTYRCQNCGTTDDYKGGERRCHHCRKVLDKPKLKAKPVNKRQTKEIIDTKVMYKCPICKKMYEKPTVCCNQEFLTDKFHGEKIKGYMCLGCKTIYNRPVKCCSGKMMIRGDVYPEMTQEEFEKIRTGLVKPITGVIQK